MYEQSGAFSVRCVFRRVGGIVCVVFAGGLLLGWPILCLPCCVLVSWWGEVFLTLRCLEPFLWFLCLGLCLRGGCFFMSFWLLFRGSGLCGCCVVVVLVDFFLIGL